MRHVSTLLAVIALTSLAAADTVNFTSGRTKDCDILQEDANSVTVLFGWSVIRIDRAMIETIAKQPPAPAATVPETEMVESRLPDFRSVAVQLAAQNWATGMQQIPATVIDNGVLRNVPYKSLRAGGDYEINVYGDPDAPACFEIGVAHGLMNSAEARKNCLDFVCSMLSRSADVAAVRALNPLQDKVVRDGLTLEITPPNAPDAYHGWWVSVYNQAALDSVRASEKELESITVAKEAVARAKTAPPNSPAVSSSGDEMETLVPWSADDLRYARNPVIVPRTVHAVRYVYIRGYNRLNGAYVQPSPHVQSHAHSHAHGGGHRH
jgi:hypothetical protein